MLDCRFRPLAQWPGEPTRFPQPSRFKAKWSQTLDLLEFELNHLRAKNIIIEGYFTFGQIRNDGWPKSTARPSKPGVVLSFDLGKPGKTGRMVMPCDRFNDWEANLRAIALTLEHLRAVERYGVTTERAEQYTGWLKLPAASSEDEAHQLAKELAILAGTDLVHVNTIATNRDAFDRAWREAARRTHPDTGGDAEQFKKVIAARDRIRALKGWN